MRQARASGGGGVGLTPCSPAFVHCRCGCVHRVTDVHLRRAASVSRLQVPLVAARPASAAAPRSSSSSSSPLRQAVVVTAAAAGAAALDAAAASEAAAHLRFIRGSAHKVRRVRLGGASVLCACGCECEGAGCAAVCCLQEYVLCADDLDASR